MSDEDDYTYGESVYFEGPCTCSHEREQHGWGSCGVQDPSGPECDCEAGWTE